MDLDMGEIGLQGGAVVKNLSANSGDAGYIASTPGLEDPEEEMAT